MQAGLPTVSQEEIDHAEVLWSFLSSGRKVLRIGSVVVKLGPKLDLAEAENMQFIAQHTHIPVPRVLNAYDKDGMGHILMVSSKGTSWTLYGHRSRLRIAAQSWPN
jgi:hypothetical protein